MGLTIVTGVWVGAEDRGVRLINGPRQGARTAMPIMILYECGLQRSKNYFDY